MNKGEPRSRNAAASRLLWAALGLLPAAPGLTALLHPHHGEFGLNNAARLDAARGVYAQVDWTWE